jgi:DNA polymerase sigma
LDFEKYISPTKKENLNRDTLLYSISQLVESLWPNNYTITTFGSSVTGLAFPSRYGPLFILHFLTKDFKSITIQ